MDRNVAMEIDVLDQIVLEPTISTRHLAIFTGAGATNTHFYFSTSLELVTVNIIQINTRGKTE